MGRLKSSRACELLAARASACENANLNLGLNKADYESKLSGNTEIRERMGASAS